MIDTRTDCFAVFRIATSTTFPFTMVDIGLQEISIHLSASALL